MMNRIFKRLASLPISFYCLLLILLPLVYIFFLSFLKSDSYGGFTYVFTLQNYLKLFDVVYLKVFAQSFFIAFITTVICILISYPFCLFVNEKSKMVQSILMTLVILPFLTNSLIRTYGWMVLLRKEGIINTILLNFHIIKEPLSLMYNNLGIIIGMVYTLLPFMILPLYSSISKIDPRYIEAAKDLGASKLTIFFKIIVPLTISGLFNGVLMVFIPCIGYFFISDLLGGGKLMLLGNLIKNQFLTARDWPFGAAISIALLLVTYLLVRIYRKSGGEMDDLGGL